MDRREERIDEAHFFVGDEGEDERDEEACGCELPFDVRCEEGGGGGGRIWRGQ